jgi:hypothetical protein
MLHLQVDQRRQDGHDYGSGEDALLAHAGAGPKGKPSN